MCFLQSVAMLRANRLLPFPALPGNAPRRTAGGVWPQPVVLPPLQVEPSMTDTVRSLRFPTKTVLVANTIPTERGSEPTGIVAGVCPQPELSVALQCRALNTETVLSSVFAT